MYLVHESKKRSLKAWTEKAESLPFIIEIEKGGHDTIDQLLSHIGHSNSKNLVGKVRIFQEGHKI